EGAEAESLFLESIDKYKRVIDIKPDQIDAFLNWGVSLSDIAEMKEGAEAESLFLESIDKYKRVIDIKPDHIDALNNWVNNLILLYRINTGKEAIIVLNQALEKGKLLQKLGGESYNLSCVYALKEDKENALKYLEISLTNNEQEIDFVLNDEDWEHYLEDEDFKALINKFR
ncbi:hypothetical protein, partial [Flammeovirga sp. EKP202]|uniref:TPR end-of-group domain-containing protein n=1 Tax=Flammeovirga sp. EKP202 TaxID=2770592 RepID=UPI0019A3FDB5